MGDLICSASIFCVLGSSEVERCLSFTARPTREKFVKAIVKSKLLQTYDFSCFFHCSNFLHIINMLLIYQAFSSEQVLWRVLSVWKLEVTSLPVLSDNLTRTRRKYGVFSHDLTAAILVSQNNETAAMLVAQTSPLGVELFSYAKLSFVPINLHICWPREWKHSIMWLSFDLQSVCNLLLWSCLFLVCCCCFYQIVLQLKRSIDEYFKASGCGV